MSNTDTPLRYFTKIDGKDGKKRAKCNSCNKIYVTGERKYETSDLNSYIMKCVKWKTKDVGQMILDMKGKLKAKKIDQVVHLKLLSSLVINHNLP